MTSKVERDEDGKPVGMSYYEIGQGIIEGAGFDLYFDAKFEIDKADFGHWVTCGFVNFEKILIKPNSDIVQEIPYPELASINGWTDDFTAGVALKEAMEDAERRANEAIDNP